MGRLDGVSVGGVSLTTEDAVLRSWERGGVHGERRGWCVVVAGCPLGSSLGVSTGVLSLSVEGGVEAVSGSGDELALGSR